jgi:methylenetetrahydrofolate reductase (NADPH)
MRIADFLKEAAVSGRKCVSFEFFPPRTPAGETALYQAIEELRPLAPTFVSVTYGAGGSTRDKTVEITGRIRNDVGIEAMAHLTCVGASRAELRGVLDRLRAEGIENVLALRGDPPQGAARFERPPDGFGYANELAAFIRAGYPFCVGGACYPEPHSECPDLDTGIAHLRLKVDAGAAFLITQLFFDNRAYFRFVEKARAAGIVVPIIPGIMPVTNVAQIERFTRTIGATIPAGYRTELQVRQDDPEAVIELGVAYATAQCRELIEGGAPGIHFYTLNKSPATRRIMKALKERGLL